MPWRREWRPSGKKNPWTDRAGNRREEKFPARDGRRAKRKIFGRERTAGESEIFRRETDGKRKGKFQTRDGRQVRTEKKQAVKKTAGGVFSEGQRIAERTTTRVASEQIAEGETKEFFGERQERGGRRVRTDSGE